MSNKTYIGELNERVVLNEIVTTKSPTTNEKLKTEVAFKTVWGKIDDVSGNESIDGRVIALNVRKYTIRYSEEIYLKSATLLIEAIDGTYNVNSVELLGRKQFLILKCSKRE